MQPEDRLDRIERILESLSVSNQQAHSRLDRIDQQIERNNQSISQLSEEISCLREITLHNIQLTQVGIEQAERDRIAFREETRQIWQYLMSKNGNGNSN